MIIGDLYLLLRWSSSKIELNVELPQLCGQCGHIFFISKKRAEEIRKRGGTTICQLCKDLYAPFYLHMQGINKRCRYKNIEKNVDIKYLHTIWERQQGICPYTGWELKLHPNTKKKKGRTPDLASVDRVQSNYGYVRDNIQFVALIVQYAKNIFSERDVIDFCRSVVINKQIR